MQRNFLERFRAIPGTPLILTFQALMITALALSIMNTTGPIEMIIFFAIWVLIAGSVLEMMASATRDR